MGATPLWKSLLIEHRIPHRYKSRENFMNENINFFFRKILKTPAMHCNPDADVDYFTIICHDHVNNYLASVKSFLRYYNDVRIVVAGDGSLTKKDCMILRKHVKGIVIYKRSYLDRYIDENMKSDFLKDLRKKDCSQLKITDVNLLCRKKKMLIDSDLLFLKRPDEIINWCRNPKSRPYYHTEKLSEEELQRSDLDEKFGEAPEGINIQFFFRKNLAKLNKKLGTNIRNFVYCAGVIGYNEELPINKIEKVQKILLSVAPEGYESWGVEQCAHGFLFKEKSDRLDDRYYFAVNKEPSVSDVKEAKMIHFIGKLKHKQYLKQARIVIRQLRS